DHLRRFVVEVGAVGVVVSCSVPIFLSGALRSVQAAQSAQIPVLVGGRAFGPDDLRARRLGADGWAPDAVAAGRLLGEWRRQPPSVGTRPVGMRDAEPLELEAARAELVAGGRGE